MKQNSMRFRELLHKGMQIVTAGYVMFLIIAIPLFYHHAYYDIGNYKNELFYKGTLIMLMTVLLFGVLALTERLIHRGGLEDSIQVFKGFVKTLSVVDIFMLTYAVISFASYVFSNYRNSALWGCGGWRMGLAAQLMFVMIYFIISRWWCSEWNRSFLYINFAVSGIICILAVLHRFTIDPLGLYKGLESYHFVEFLTTIGQATWYSSYLCVMLPIGVMLFFFENEKRDRLLLGIYCFIGFASLVTQNSDSAFIALGVLMFILFLNAFASPASWRRFLEVLLLCLFSMRLIGILQMMFPEKVVPLEDLSIFFSQHIVMWIALTAVVILYVISWIYQRKDAQQRKDTQQMEKLSTICTWLRILVFCVAAVMIPLVIVLIYLTTTQHLPDWLSFLYDMGYFRFDDDWGNARGFTWKLSAKMFGEFGVREKLLGCGPDMYSEYVKAYHMGEMTERFGNSVLPNAHNEWFNMLICEGVLGLAAYAGIFCAAARSLFRDKKCCLGMAVAVSILCYMGHNFFCYQQVMCTPFIFMFIGIGMAMSKNVGK